ncbi:E3 ubiquitin-protein ligase WAV3-like isoform X2 [Coffea arabica]|uniref:E3 ubiquitin-protein ligase WAV3-like isoform X2 n=1 Tax=Coffea arabica TaxID=13443 RepID=A0ABM4VNP4_COFAR
MVGGGGGGGGASRKLKKAAKKILSQTCASFSWTTTSNTSTNQTSHVNVLPDTPSNALHSICTICLDPLNCSSGSNPCPAIFTAQCSHAFHFACISSNVCHGSMTCPICRAHWTQLPRNLDSHCSLQSNQSDPILQILDDSIASFRVHRRSFLLSAHYDDDDPVEPDHASDHQRLHISLLPFHLAHPDIHLCAHTNSGVSVGHSRDISLQHQLTSPSHLMVQSSVVPAEHPATAGQYPFACTSTRAYLCVRLEHQPATDLVLVASPNGPHLRLMKQAMALVIFSLRAVDRLAIVTYSSAAARMFPLKRMTSYGKRTALQVIDRLFHTGPANPIVGLKKGVKVLSDRVYRNPESCILHLSDGPTRSYHSFSTEVPVRIYRFHVGFGFGTLNGFVMHEFEEFLARMLGGAIKEIRLKIKEDARVIKLGELRGGEERRIPLILRKCGHVCVEYSYVDSGIDECSKTGEIVVGIPDQSERNDGLDSVASMGGRTSSAESWDYHDSFMARRWAKHLHGNRPLYPTIYSS